MRKILAFYMDGCPYCVNAKRALAELISENPAYGKIEIEWVNDNEAAELYKTHPYDYVPNMWFDTTLKYEARPGESYAQTKQYIKEVLEQAL